MALATIFHYALGPSSPRLPLISSDDLLSDLATPSHHPALMRKREPEKALNPTTTRTQAPRIIGSVAGPDSQTMAMSWSPARRVTESRALRVTTRVVIAADSQNNGNAASHQPLPMAVVTEASPRTKDPGIFSSQTIFRVLPTSQQAHRPIRPTQFSRCWAPKSQRRPVQTLRFPSPG
ncbi:uncharacterized protein BDZ99DRAFT_471468 [Mytilinidion resinicola]|uniref:Uncharacterized protein n=1 Tax=Mytilinidion resinicola TaxID=574789 RepID=A0A6A6Z666_9PEZI|nr:uncharacterized protein BDZ99DRAFT_471468 [Mytilinidion resinicola]KAF2816209.1 hypothetical protein BDZ99DRAFT_471468 [Mytilinidion resinicola]